jgi:uncharacterized membrane protein YeaQ/YmgE (transglycosylase-associated protein family)
MGFISMIVVGLIAGLIARAIMPGPDPMGWLGTIILGIVGSFVGGFLASTLLGRGTGNAIEPTGIVGSIIGALVVLAIYRMVRRRTA